MKTSKCTDEQITLALRQAEADTPKRSTGQTGRSGVSAYRYIGVSASGIGSRPSRRGRFRRTRLRIFGHYGFARGRTHVNLVGEFPGLSRCS
jgi:hypothetical protein